MSHAHDRFSVHHVRAVENILEAWRWNQRYDPSDHQNYHFLILNEENPVSINLHAGPEDLRPYRHFNAIINRGASVSLTYKHTFDAVKTITLTNDIPYEMEYEHSNQIFHISSQSSSQELGLVFNLIKFDLSPILFPHSIPDARPSLTGRLAFQCDWTGAKTLSVWRDGTHKIFKFYNVKSGYHCVDYDIPRTLVAPWTASGKTRIMPLDLRVEDAGVERMVWTGATKLDVPDLSFSQNESDSD